MEMNPKNKAGCFAELLSALSAAIVTPDNRMYFNSGADTDRVRIAIQKCYSPLPDGKPDIANDVPEAIPYFCIEFRDYVPTITMGGSVFRLKNGKVNCFLHGQKLYTAPPRVVDAKVIEALKDAEEIMHAYFFPANECKDCGNHVDGWHETGCIAGSILDKHRKIISELEAK